MIGCLLSGNALFRQLPTDAIQTAALLGNLKNVNGNDLLAENPTRRRNSSIVRFRTEHWQKNTAFRLKKIQIAADGTVTLARLIREIDNIYYRHILISFRTFQDHPQETR